MNKTDDNIGWQAGWSLSAPLETLFHETTSPLSAVLSATQGVLELASPDAGFRIAIKEIGAATTRVTAHGLRISYESSDKDGIASVMMLDPAILLLEADEHMIRDVLAQPGFEHSIDEAFYYSDEEQHRLGILVDIKSSPMRIAVVAGTGEREIMCARARGYLSKSAHGLVDAELNKAGTLDTPDAFDPQELIKSRMRAATSHIPYPWLSDTDEEPVWNLELLYPVFLSYLHSDQAIAGGIINNFLEMMDENGSVPSAGGNIGNPIFSTPEFPILTSMCAAFHKQTGKLPGETSDTLASLIKYLNSVISGTDDCPPQLLLNELRSLRYIARSIGRLGYPEVQTLLQTKFPQQTEPNTDSDAARIPFFLIIGNDQRLKKGDQSISSAAQETINILQQQTADAYGPFPCLTLLAANNYQVTDYQSYSEWISTINSMNRKKWNENTRVSGDTQLLSFAAFITATAYLSRQAFDRTKLREQRVYQFIEKNKKWVIGASALLLLGFAAFVISVLMRQTMPISVYETNVGMIIQHYKSNQFQDALNMIEEIEQRGAAENIQVRYFKAKSLFKTGDYAAAADEFKYLIEKRPRSPSSHYNLALCHYHDGDFETAAEAFGVIADQFKATHPSIAAYARQAREIALSAME